MLQGTGQKILLIEPDASLRRLITLGLQYRGMHVIETSSLVDLPTMETQQPDLVVLDIDGEVGANSSLLTAVQEHPYLSLLPMVLLTWECFPHSSLTCLTKPFDARTLQATVERLLLSTGKVTTIGSSQDNLPDSRVTTTAPSIWPLVTATGLLLAFIGLMISITISAVGLLIMLVALFSWTLGLKSDQQTLHIEMGKTYHPSPTSLR